MTLSIDSDRLEEILSLLQDWLEKMLATKKQYQQLIGLLNFVAACVRPGRIFLSRMYIAMKYTPETGTYPISKSFRKDLIWWNKFIQKYNGISMMCDDLPPD